MAYEGQAYDIMLHAWMGKITSWLSPASLGLATFDWLTHFAISPAKQLDLTQKTWKSLSQFNSAVCFGWVSFEWSKEAKRFFEVLQKRLKKYELELHMEKSQIISAGHIAALRAHQEGKRLPTFNFLGFTCYWGKSRSKLWRLKYTSRKDRFAAKLKGMHKYLWENLNTEHVKET